MLDDPTSISAAQTSNTVLQAAISASNKVDASEGLDKIVDAFRLRFLT